jgi:hypothetical protein
VLDFSTDARALQSAVDALTRNALTADPQYDVSTNLNGAVLHGLGVLDARQDAMARGQLFSGSLVVFTDGTDQAGRVADEAAVSAVAASPHACFTIGLGGETDELHLEALGRNGFAWAADSDGLGNAFDTIAEDIRAESGKHYILGYCSPKRKGTHRVTLRVKDYAGSISYTFAADTFTGGCDPLAITDGFEPGSGTCVLSVQPESVRKIPLVPRYVLLTVTAPAPLFNRSSRVAIDGVTVLPPIVARPAKLVVPDWITAGAQAGPRDVTVTTGSESLTCYDLLTIR